ncbi:ATP-binding protein [Pedobacter sp. Leaf250]|uniref:ATP-binding protein n=1 Tax=Pedobacter sp. Leaf250 TaxID=2876559 RepID=UPI00351CF950
MFPKFEIFDDRLEITSYGSLSKGLSQNEFFEGFSVPRNKELMRFFKDLDLVEQMGSGVPRILQAYKADCFQFSENSITITRLCYSNHARYHARCHASYYADKTAF